jgi:hypothetical protein
MTHKKKYILNRQIKIKQKRPMLLASFGVKETKKITR